ncbi:MAG: hypothetical protein DMG00_07775 [Acidobacteria bacterium]|nr:MAG: hypothetical protein DMG00_07775 [Acidobacteriota bacterium]
MREENLRHHADRRSVPRGGRRAADEPGRYPPILVADPHLAVCETVSRYLAMHHFDAAQAQTNAQLRDLVETARPQLSTPTPPPLAWLSESRRTRHIPLIVMVGAYDVNTIIPPVAGILVKPFSLSWMLDEIRRVLRPELWPLIEVAPFTGFEQDQR